MPALGLDYAYARPDGAALAAAGVTAVGRYLADPADGRQIELTEYQNLARAGIRVWFVREGAATGMLGGRAKGVSDARIAVANLARLGLEDQVVYAAADWDVGFTLGTAGEVVAAPQQIDACDDYLRGFASVVGIERTGIYGGLYYLNHAYQAGLARRFWQAGAVSWNHGLKPAMTVDIEQTTQKPPLPDTDHNKIHTADYGQAGPRPAAQEDTDMLLIYGDTKPVFIGPNGVRDVNSPAEEEIAKAVASKVLTWNQAQVRILKTMIANGINDSEGIDPQPAGDAQPLDLAPLLAAVGVIPAEVVAALAAKLGA